MLLFQQDVKILLKEIANQYENISSFPLDVTDKSKCKEVFENIKR